MEAAKRYSLADTFDLTHFKDYQTRIIDAVIEKRDTLVVQPTGSGKSLCFQFPAVYTRKLSLVVSPTISLMQDQTLQLQARGISAMYLGSAQMDPQAESKVFSPDSNVSVLFVSPEWLFQNDDTNLRKVQKIREAGRMGLIAVDEAHLICDWEDFRPAYNRCKDLHSLFPGIPIMALSATVTPQVQKVLESFLINPVIEKSSVNRENIFLAAEQCNFKRVGGSKQSAALDSRDFNSFADRVTELISDECSIVYTDFACHVAPIVLALRDRNVQAVGYYGKMKEGEKNEAFLQWKRGEVQVIVATRAFGLGINKSDVRFVIRNGLPPSISAWTQEYGRAGRDGKQSYAYILYADNDIHHVGFWARDMARQHRQNDIHNSAEQFSYVLPFTHAHLAGNCRRKLLVGMFGENGDSLVTPEKCCDVCETCTTCEDRKLELKTLIRAIDELGRMGEVKVTEWIRGGQISWMSSVEPSADSAYGQSAPGLSKEWWRMFIRQCAAAGYITRNIKPATFGSVQGSYASLNVTDKGRTCATENPQILLPVLNIHVLQQCASSRSHIGSGNGSGIEKPGRKRIGKGKHMLPILKKLIEDRENWKELSENNKECYQYPGLHSSPSTNLLYHANDISKLPHYSDTNPHFMWSDIQLSKSSTSKNKMSVKIDGQVEEFSYWMSQCKGVKKCSECDHVVSNSNVKNNCSGRIKLITCLSSPPSPIFGPRQ